MTDTEIWNLTPTQIEWDVYIKEYKTINDWKKLFGDNNGR